MSVLEGPLVSIITPSFNQANFLEYTIQSVLKQDYPWIEYLIVDGGSSDGSVDIIQSSASRLAWWVSEPDEGQAAAINKGFSRARGEIVAWLNSDDLYLPGAVRQAVAAFQANHEDGMIFGDAITIDAQGSPLKQLAFPDWDLDDFIGFRIICQPAVFMRREVLDQVGGLDLNYHFMLDHQLWIRIARLAPVKHISATWAAARHHASAKNISQASGFGQETLRLLAWMETQPDLSALIKKNRRMVMAGAYRLNGRYLLDGGQPGPALRSYTRAFLAQPGYALRHWQRIVYAAVSVAGMQRLAKRVADLRTNHKLGLQQDLNLNDWPGLRLKEPQ